MLETHCAGILEGDRVKHSRNSTGDTVFVGAPIPRREQDDIDAAHRIIEELKHMVVECDDTSFETTSGWCVLGSAVSPHLVSGHWLSGLVFFQRLRLSSSVCIRPQKGSIIALCQQSPIDPIDGTNPERLARSVRAHEVNCTPWSE